ncbi:MAG: signal peptidase I [Clostridiales bacterium]|nr:signal peptidase I [Candidatus Blautia equi]
MRDFKLDPDKLLPVDTGKRKTLRDLYVEFVDEKLRHILNWSFAIIVTLALAATTAIVFFQSVTMQESSMEPTLGIGERFFMNRLIYRISDPQRGDIIVFRSNSSDDAVIHVRRVIGIPGDTVQISKGNILINGEVYREPQDFPTIVNPGTASSPITLEDDQYFVLGDNRNNSEDSRYGEIGNIDAKYIVGKLWFVASPMEKLGFLRG